MAIIGYIRVSSHKQTCEHQHFEIKQFINENNLTVERWVMETVSSRERLENRILGKLLHELDPNDILIATEISRLGRSLLEVMRILEYCLNKNCQVWTVKENYRLGNDIQSKVMAFAFGLSAEIERNLISQRTKASLENVRACGRKLGRPLSEQSQKLRTTPNTNKIIFWLDIGLSRYKIAKLMGVSPTTVSRFVRRLRSNSVI